MNTKDYVKNALKTKSYNYDAIINRLFHTDVDLLHAGMGVTTEAGEFLDTIKKYVYYGKDLDQTNLIEEIGDIFYYLAIACNALDISFEQVMEKNIEKLKARYGEKFTEEKAINRNITNEREILER